ncbi:hypothetical protein ACTJIL_00985 [Luteimonas sp. 22616]|uniref:hypothetical protein n=1 Tax=Luteimonas sp. 22616 TaxID=3453951 RepID=UPI003F8296C9
MPGEIKSLRLQPLPQGLSDFGFGFGFAVDADLDSRGPSVAAEAVDKTRRAPHMDVRRFPQGQDAPSENPAGSADPVRSAGRAGGVCFFGSRFFAQAKKGDSRRHGAKRF